MLVLFSADSASNPDCESLPTAHCDRERTSVAETRDQTGSEVVAIGLGR
jgi:hypothetical protein